MSDTLLNLGVGSAVALMILNSVFTFLKERRHESSGNAHKILLELRDISREVHDLHGWRDADRTQRERIISSLNSIKTRVDQWKGE